MMDYKDYYKILGVEKNASEKEIKAAYRKLAREYHPDVNPNNPAAEAKFKEINEANEVLGTPEKRAKYDQLGANWQQWQQAGRAPGGFNWQQWSNAPGGSRETNINFEDLFGGRAGGNADFSDFFSTFFAGGMGPQGSRARAGQDSEHEIEITLAEAYNGTLRALSNNGKRIDVRIPAGANNGTKVRVRGQGYAGVNGGADGDLYLKVKITPDAHFERKEDDLHTTVPVDLYTAVLGGEITVPTLAGEVKLKIPEGAQNGQTFRLRGKGMPQLRKSGQHGDLYARLDVRLPSSLTPQQRQLFEQLREL